MNEDKFQEITDDIVLYLYRKGYEDPEKDMIRVRIMYFLTKVCISEENFIECSKILDEARLGGRVKDGKSNGSSSKRFR